MNRISPAEYSVEAYAAFPLSGGELRSVAPLEALLDDPEIAACLRVASPPGRGVRKGVIGFGLFAALLAAFCLLPGWRMFPKAPAAPAPAATEKPVPFAGTPPEALRGAVEAVGNDIAAGNRWGRVFAGLAELVGWEAPVEDREVRVWACTELLVSLASRDVAPDWANDALADRAFALLTEGNALSVRACSAYARLLRAAPGGQEAAAGKKLLAVLETFRALYPEALDRDAELLALEAEQHIAAFPREYDGGERELDYHWRRAAHALGKLSPLDPGEARLLERRRWERVRGYFDFALTLDLQRLGRRGYLTLDGTRYDRNAVEALLAASPVQPE